MPVGARADRPADGEHALKLPPNCLSCCQVGCGNQWFGGLGGLSNSQKHQLILACFKKTTDQSKRSLILQHVTVPKRIKSHTFNQGKWVCVRIINPQVLDGTKNDHRHFWVKNQNELRCTQGGTFAKTQGAGTETSCRTRQPLPGNTRLDMA